jgi:sec-independent protein translocase protein TatA
MGIESPVHLLFIAVVALIVLGPKRLPELARAVGKGIREFRGALEQGGASGSAAAPSAPTPPAELPAPVPGPAGEALKSTNQGAAADEPR